MRARIEPNYNPAGSAIQDERRTGSKGCLFRQKQLLLGYPILERIGHVPGLSRLADEIFRQDPLDLRIGQQHVSIYIEQDGDSA
jgi:hypothetical protein